MEIYRSFPLAKQAHHFFFFLQGKLCPCLSVRRPDLKNSSWTYQKLFYYSGDRLFFLSSKRLLREPTPPTDQISYVFPAASASEGPFSLLPQAGIPLLSFQAARSLFTCGDRWTFVVSFPPPLPLSRTNFHFPVAP